LFNGADNYKIANNDICGNFSAEYGGGISHFGLSSGGSIHDNRIYYNQAYDEGGAILVAGELAVDPLADYNAPNGAKGSGAVDIYNNLIQANMSDDDGGGIRLLMAGNFPMNLYNNMIVNNISTHEGGGIAIDDATNVRFFNNTVMKNITTATAVTSTGQPAPAGLSTGRNSIQLQNLVGQNADTFSNPVLFNNIFWDNRAGSRGINTVTGIGAAGDNSPINNWDMGAFDQSGLLSPTYSILQTSTGVNFDNSNSSSDPLVFTPFDVSVAFTSWRTNVNLIGATMVTADLPPTLLGNYHIPLNSPAVDKGADSSASVNAPTYDYDHEGRPVGKVDIGADEANGVPGGAFVAFPKTSILDNFNRTNSPTLCLAGSNWSIPCTGASIASKVAVSGAGSIPTTWIGNVFGPSQEAYFKFTRVARVADQSLLLKYSGSASDPNMIQVTYNATVSPASVSVWTRTAGAATPWIKWATFPMTFSANDIFGARAMADGSVRVYKNGVQYGLVYLNAGSNPWPNALIQNGGKIGFWFLGTSSSRDARFDDFGGGTMP
jgi:hypothetical protein